MNFERKKIKIEIFNSEYSLISDEKEDDILYASEMVDSLMREIADKSGLKDEKKIAVLAALRIASKLMQSESALQHYEKRQHEIAHLIEKKGLSSSL